MREELGRRPLLVFCLTLIVGLTLARHPINLLLLLPAPWVLTRARAILVALSGLVVGAVIGPGQPQSMLTESHFLPGTWHILSVPRLTPFGQSCEVERDGLRLKLLYDGPLELCPGETVYGSGLAEPPKEGSEAYFAARGLVGTLKVLPESLQRVSDANWLQRTACSWRSRFMSLASSNLSPEARATAAALVFNADGALSEETRDEMQRTGTTHIIAASGLQVVVIAQALFWLLMLVPIPRTAQIGVVVGILVMYAMATGLHPPIVRAVLMSAIANSAYLFRREPDWPTALAASSIFYLLWKPATVYEMGFQFSVIAVLFISMFGVQVKWRPGFTAWMRRGLVRSFRAAFIAYVVMAPIIAYYFGVVSLVSIPANLLIVGAVAPIVVISLVALPLSFLSTSASGALLWSTQWPIAYIQSTLHALGGERSVLQIPAFSAYWLMLFYALLILIWRPYVRPV